MVIVFNHFLQSQPNLVCIKQIIFLKKNKSIPPEKCCPKKDSDHRMVDWAFKG